MAELEEIKCLEKFVLSNPELDHLENLVSEFNIFEALNLRYAEIRHSSFLVWLLNPYENHGLGNYFIRQFLKRIASLKKSYFSSADVSVFDFELFLTMMWKLDVNGMQLICWSSSMKETKRL